MYPFCAYLQYQLPKDKTEPSKESDTTTVEAEYIKWQPYDF